MNPVAVARGSPTVPDGVLVQEAAAGGGASYAALYDRYSEQVYNYCLRLTGSPHDAADAMQGAFVGVLARLQHDERPVLDFASYLFAAARNESYALMRTRSRAAPSDELPDRTASQPDLETDPERAALLHDSQEAVRRANAQLPPRHREVLALREVAGRSYDEIGEIMGISENAAAQLIFRARGKLREAMTAGAVASVVATTGDCEHAQLLITRLQDGETITDHEQEWLDDHLEHCGSCRAARGMLVEVGATYSAWALVPAVAALRPEILTRAGEAIGMDWSGVAASTPPPGSGAAGSGQSGTGGGGAGTGGNGAGASTGATAAAGGVAKARGHHAVAQGALGAAVIAVAGIVTAGILHDDSPVKRDAAPAEQIRPAEEPDAGPVASAAKAKSAASAPAAGIHGFQSLAGSTGPADRSLSTPPAAGPESIDTPVDKRGNSPDGSPRPNGGQPNSGGPNGGGPENGPGGGGPKGGAPGGGAPGGGPANPGSGPPATPPGGGQTDPPGQPTDPGTKPPPPENPPPSTGGDCTWPGHGNGPAGCPPGQGGIPPGHGGTPPGQGKKP